VSSGLGELRRVLGPLTGAAVCVGMAVGAGILRTPGEVAAALPSAWWILGVWALGALVATLDALILAEMASSVPRVGGLVAYVHLSFGKRAAFLVGWSMLLITWPASLASVALVTGELLTGGSVTLTTAETSPAALVVSVVVIAGVAGINLVGLRFGARVEIALFLAKAGLLAAVCIAAVAAGGRAEAAPATTPFPDEPAALLAAVGGAMLGVIWTYDGYADAVYLAGETRDPGRALPRALFTALATITGLYLLANATFLWVLGAEGLAHSKFAGLDVARTAFGDHGPAVLLVAAVPIMLGAVNAYFLTGPRIARVLAEEGLALPLLGRVPESGAPVASTLWIAMVAIAFVLTNTFEELLHVTVPIITVTTMMVAAGLLVQRVRAPERARPFRTPAAAVVVTLQVVLGAFLLASFVGYDEQKCAESPDRVPALWIDAAALGLGLLVYEIVRRRRGAS
jgi:APA family basic amino acid/polyamine antiporter